MIAHSSLLLTRTHSLSAPSASEENSNADVGCTQAQLIDVAAATAKRWEN